MYFKVHNQIYRIENRVTFEKASRTQSRRKMIYNRSCDTSYFRYGLLKWRKTAELEAAPINSKSWFARHPCFLRPTYQGVHVACLRKRRDGVPSKVFDQCYPRRIVTRIRCDGSQEQRKLVGIRKCRRRRAKRYLNHVPIRYNFGQCFSHFGTSGSEQKWH